VKQHFEYLKSQGMRQALMVVVFQEEWATKAATEIGIETQTVKDSLIRLNSVRSSIRLDGEKA